MPDSHAVLLAVSSTLVSLHKQQFGRGPTRARAEWAGPDMLVCALEDALLPAERDMVAMNAGHRVAEQRLFMQTATEPKFVDAIERIVGRKVASFASATDPKHSTIFEVFKFERDVRSPAV